ncbi:MAG: hypothetical protein ACTSQF_13340 [Candidatus Heimdallarchaeaceae archaeon]
MEYEKILQDVFMIRKILVVQHEQCLPLFEMDLNSQVNLDPSIICDILETQDPLKVEKIGTIDNVRLIKYYGFVVYCASYKSFSSYLFCEREMLSDIGLKTENLVKWFDLFFGFDSTEGDYSKEFSDFYKLSILDKITHLFSFWLLYPLEIDLTQLAKIESETELLRDILAHFAEHKQTSIMRLMNELEQYTHEELLTLIFKLVEKEFIITATSDQFTQTFFELDKK